MEVNKIYNENCLDTMARMEDNFINLTVTSPPYDDLRDYKGYTFQFEEIAKELYRVTKEGGALVWVVGDSLADGDESGTSFRQALYFKEIGFKLFDTMIYVKNGGLNSGSNKAYIQHFEYMFVFSKGELLTRNLIKDRVNKHFNQNIRPTTKRDVDGKFRTVYFKVAELSKRYNVWEYTTGNNHTTKDKIAFSHPAIFPEKLANDHIISWSNEGDLIYDPFMGSGTTGKMAKLNYRNYIGSDMSKEYCDIAEERIKSTLYVKKEVRDKFWN